MEMAQINSLQASLLWFSWCWLLPMWMNVTPSEERFWKSSQARKTQPHVSLTGLTNRKKNELTDDALKSHFYDSLHPAILYHIHNCVMQRQSLSTNLTSHIVELRHIDAVLRSGNSRCRSDTSPVSTSHLKNLLATTSIAIPITLSAGDPMVLSASNLERNIT